MLPSLAIVAVVLLEPATGHPSLIRNAPSPFLSFQFGKKALDPAARLGRRSFSSPLTENFNDGEYYIDVQVGTPPQPLSLVLDTGSSDIWAYAPEAASSCSGCTTTYCQSSHNVSRAPLLTDNR